MCSLTPHQGNLGILNFIFIEAIIMFNTLYPFLQNIEQAPDILAKALKLKSWCILHINTFFSIQCIFCALHLSQPNILRIHFIPCVLLELVSIYQPDQIILLVCKLFFSKSRACTFYLGCADSWLCLLPGNNER